MELSFSIEGSIGVCLRVEGVVLQVPCNVPFCQLKGLAQDWSIYPKEKQWTLLTAKQYTHYELQVMINLLNH